MNKQHKDYFYFHATEENKNSILDIVKQNNIQNIDVVSEKILNQMSYLNLFLLYQNLEQSHYKYVMLTYHL